MADDFEDQAVPVEPAGVGTQLRAAREARGLTLEQLAAETRIPQRHLQTIEDGDFSKLPARTYAIGFARTYAKAVGLHDGDVASLVRAELDAQERPRHRPAGFEPGDPARVPSSGLVWVVLAALVLLLIGGFFFMRTLFTPAAELPSLVEQERAAQAERAEAQRSTATRTQGPAAANGPVVFTALEPRVWVKFYDASGRQLMQKEMAEGERYTVPADAQGPQVWTGRPDALAITIGGRPVPKLADEEQVVKGVPVTAQALLARGRAAAGPSPAPSPTT